METFKTTLIQLVSPIKLILIISPLLFFLNCSPEDSVLQDNNEVQTYLPIQSLYTTSSLIAENNLYGNGQEGINEEHYLITSNDTWIRLMHQLNTVNDVTSTFTDTNIDFNEFQVIAVFDEIQNSGGHRVNMELLWNEDNISVRVIKTGPEGNATSVITQPFQIIKIPTSNLPIVFDHVHTTRL